MVLELMVQVMTKLILKLRIVMHKILILKLREHNKIIHSF